MSSKTSRRDFIKQTAFTTIAIWASDRAWAKGSKSPNERVQIACIGVGGKGESDTANANKYGTVIAICDVDDNILNAAAQKYPKAKKYNDYRKMLEEMDKDIDAVTVSTPDHHHGPADSMAISMGKHCYGQKPLTHSIFETRRLEQLAREKKVVTQMGNQGTANNSMREAAYKVRAGMIGNVSEVHVWTNRPIWPQGVETPPSEPVPSYLHWDYWIGPRKKRPYSSKYEPFVWRGFWSFGTGAMGDMGCHTINLPFMALDLRNPVYAVAETSGNNKISYPISSKIEWHFDKNEFHGPLKMWWYDGGKMPPSDLLPGVELPSSGSIMIGDKGKLFAPGDTGDVSKVYGGVDVGDVSYPVSPGAWEDGHWMEFINAIHGEGTTMSNFPDYAGPLTETCLVGNLAVWMDGVSFEWDSKNMKTKGVPELDPWIHPRFLNGYKLF
jgi:predicted dehydrogenase